MTAEEHSHSTRLALLERSMEGVEKNLTGINNNISKLVWMLVPALFTALGTVLWFLITRAPNA